VIRQGNGAKENSKILSIFQGDQIKYHCNLKILMGPFLNINSFFFKKKKKNLVVHAKLLAQSRRPRRVLLAYNWDDVITVETNL